MSTTRVIIVGCGITGPVLATFLKLKGYDPIIYERMNADAHGGIGLALQANGLRVLSLIPGFDVDSIPGQWIDKMISRSWIPDSGEAATLGEGDIGILQQERFGYKMKGVERPGFQRMIIQMAKDHGIEIKWEHSLISFEQGDKEVHVTFENGHTDVASFVVGCDGLHSNTRSLLFGRERADFTGLTQTGGLTKTKDAYSEPFTMVNIYGDGATLVLYRVSATHTAWAVTIREDEAKESWREMNEQKQLAFKNGPLSNWGFEGEGLVKNAEKLVKYGLYDRPELKTWYKARVVLLGDAAHPTSPHLGQGANQGFEDIYHLVRLLVKHNPTASPPSTAQLSAVFAEYEGIRIPRTAELVKHARKMGELRVAEGVAACSARNETIKNIWADVESALDGFENVLSGPFQGKSEI